MYCHRVKRDVFASSSRNNNPDPNKDEDKKQEEIVSFSREDPAPDKDYIPVEAPIIRCTRNIAFCLYAYKIFP